MNNEHQRIDAELFGERLRGPSIVVIAKSADASASLSRVKEVMRLIAAASDSGSWPSDEEWLQILPLWFTEPFQGRTIEQVLQDDTLWDYGSWLDAMRQRGWRWWGASCHEDYWSAILLRDEDVYSIDPLIYLTRQSGASSVEVAED
jgi:hypothetical protein